jgi:ferritin
MNLSENIKLMLTEQYRMENFNSFRYTQRRGWADFSGFTGAASFFKQESEGEKGHAEKVLSFILDRSDLSVIEPVLFNESVSYGELSLEKCFIDILRIEKETTASLIAIYKEAFAELDIMTVNFMAEMISLQIEEEKTAQTILDRFRNYPECPSREHDIDIYILDNFVAD